MKLNNLLRLFILSTIISMTACSVSNKVKDTTNKESRDNGDILNPDNAVSLIDHLRKISGVRVRGNESGATIEIRGTTSINAGTEPLFVVDGSTIMGGLQAANQIVPVSQIKRIKVLKNASETALYGSRGANGVIEISLK